MPLLWFWIATIGMVLFLAQAYFADGAGMLTPTQMQARGILQGVPFTGHGSTWFVLIGLIPLVATIVALNSSQWTTKQMLYAFLASVAISGVMHWLYTKAPYADYMVSNGQLSPAGWCHFVLFSGAIAVLLLFYLATKHESPAMVLLTSWYMVGHVFAGNHMITRMSPPSWFPPYPFWDVAPMATIGGVAALLGWATWWALR